MGPVGCHETSVQNYHYSLCNVPEERTYRLQELGISGTCYLLLAIGIEETGTAVLECMLLAFQK